MKNDGTGFNSESARAAGRKSKGGGRPKRAMADLMDEGGAAAIEHLLRIINHGETHSLYIEALRELTRACLPKRRATDVTMAEKPKTFVELANELKEASLI